MRSAPGSCGAQAMTAVNEFQGAWDVALVVFGLHLLVLGYLALRSSHIPGLLGILVMVAGLGYLVDSFGGLLSKATTPMSPASPSPGGAAHGLATVPRPGRSMADVAVAGLDEAALVGEDDDLGAVAQAELGQDARHV